MNKLSIITAISLTLFLTACGEGEIQTDRLSSSQAVDNLNLTCNMNSSGSLSVKSKVFKHHDTFLQDHRYNQVRLGAIPTSFSTNGTLQFSAWQVSTGNSIINRKTVPSLLFMDNVGYLSNTWANSISYSQLQTYANSYNMSVVELLSRTTIILNIDDPSGSFEGLTVEHAASNSSVDLLLPPFKLLPSDYSKDLDGSNRPQILQALHPFANQSSASLESLTIQASGFCW